jgi:large repetitive protein
MVRAGYGTAAGVSLSSCQPQIVDNRKGLLVDFVIEGATLGASTTVARTLTLTLGDIPPRSAALVRWQLAASLQGRFASVDASFTTNNPFGDPTLSSIAAVSIHDLVHVVFTSKCHAYVMYKSSHQEFLLMCSMRAED